MVTGVRASTSLIDRGEQIGFESFEAEIIAEKSVEKAVFYGGVYRLLPVGADSEFFDNETDYIIGMNYTANKFNFDFSANYITYPAESADASMELVAAIGVETFLLPEFVTFYDTETKDFGGELLLHSERKINQLDIGISGRAGFVNIDETSSTRNYLGLEIRVSHSVGKNLDFGVYARGDIADRDAFVDKLVRSDNHTYTNSGVALGVEMVFRPNL